MPNRIVKRPSEPWEWNGFWTAAETVYNNGDPIPEDRKRVVSDAFVIIEDGEVIGRARGEVFDNFVRGVLMPCSAVAGVAVPSHFRRGGVGTELMAGLVRDLYDHLVPISTLYAFREPFYGKNGYAAAGRRIEVSVPADRFPKGADGLTIRRLRPSDWHLLNPVYEAFARRYSGMFSRNEERWQRVLAENRELTIYGFGDPLEAYIVVSHRTDFWSKDHMSEFVWSTPQGYDNGLGFLRSLSINKTGLSWYEPGDSPFLAHYVDQGVGFQIVRHLSVRVVHVEEFFRRLDPTTIPDCRVTLSVDDPSIPANAMPIEVMVNDGHLTVTPVEQADLRIPIALFSQIAFGEPSATELIAVGRITGSLSALDALQKLLPPYRTYCADFF